MVRRISSATPELTVPAPAVCPSVLGTPGDCCMASAPRCGIRGTFHWFWVPGPPGGADFTPAPSLGFGSVPVFGAPFDPIDCSFEPYVGFVLVPNAWLYI